jgi:hypothetical protein
MNYVMMTVVWWDEPVNIRSAEGNQISTGIIRS